MGLESVRVRNDASQRTGSEERCESEQEQLGSGGFRNMFASLFTPAGGDNPHTARALSATAMTCSTSTHHCEPARQSGCTIVGLQQLCHASRCSPLKCLSAVGAKELQAEPS